IVYILKANGKAVPQGMPLFTYEVEAAGRISQACLDSIVRTGQWERDMIVFHLLKYKDRKYVPEINEPISQNNSGENFSTWAVKKLSDESLNTEEKPSLTRGRRFKISFGPNQQWEGVYWGKDELGHVVAHDTHDKWSVMHLDLN